MFLAWNEQAQKLEHGEITKDEYDWWRYRYPELDTSQRLGKVPSQELSNYLIKTLREST